MISIDFDIDNDLFGILWLHSVKFEISNALELKSKYPSHSKSVKFKVLRKFIPF